jgi:hypothetical protein
MTRPVSRSGFAVIALVAASCSSPRPAAESLPALPTPRIVDNAGTSGAQCDAQYVAARPDQLFEAISEGKPNIAEEFFGMGRSARFQWYSFTEHYADPPRHFVTYSPDSLNEHFEERHAEERRLRLRGVTFNRRDTYLHFGPVDFDYLTPGSAGGPSVVYEGTGKGAYSCPTDSFVVLSLGAVPVGQGFRLP